MASLFALGCGSSSETLSPPPPASAVVVVDPAPDSIQPCDLVDGARASELLGITVAERRVPPEDDASLCDYLADGGEPVVRLSLATGSTRDQFDDRLASRLLPGEELRPVATAADVAFWNPGRRILVALREDVVVQVIYIGPRFTADEEGSVVARTLVDALVSGIDALGRGPTVTPPPEPVFADLPGRDLSARSYEDNLLAKVQAGEWTLAAGLIQTLQLLAGEVPETGVLRDPATFAGFEATGIIAMGYEYVRDGDDPAARTEISRLLERLVFTPDRLAAMADSESTASSRPVGTGIQLASWSSAEASPVEDCASFYDGWAVPAGVADCLRVELVEASGTTFSIYVPDLDAVDVGWTEAHPDMVRQTIADTVGPFNELGSLPSQMAIVFSAAKHASAAMQAIQPPGQDWCTVTIFTNVLKNDDETLRFLVSHEFGHCFQNATMPDQQVPYPDRRWREEGFAEYLASVVYPELDKESRFVNDFLAYELNEVTVGAAKPGGVFDEGGSLVRSYENVVWFNSLRDAVGGTDALIRLLQTGPNKPGIQPQIAFLLGIRRIEELHHQFHLDVADGRVFDVDGDQFPAGNLVSGGWFVTPSQEIALSPEPFGVVKWEVKVESGKVATMTIKQEDTADLRASARPLNDEVGWFPLQDGVELEATCEEDGVFLVVATRTSDSAEPPFITLGASEVADLEECKTLATPPAPTTVPFDTCLVGEWRMDLGQYATMRRAADNVMAAATNLTVDGSVTLKIDALGAVALRISDYREFGEWDNGDITITSSGEAQGSWEANGSVLRATWTRLDFATSISSYLGSAQPNAPPVDIVQVPQVAGYRCDDEQLRYAYPPAGPFQRWTRTSR